MLRNKSLRRLLAVVALIALLLTVLAGLTAGKVKAAPPELQLTAKSAVLLDAATGQVLYEKSPDLKIPPASLTKLMTLHIAYKKIGEGFMKREDKVQVRNEAWAAAMEGSSVMFLEPGQIVTVGEIMKGIAIPSGNDAAIAMAQHIGGSVDAFVAMMNKEAQDLGFKTMKFVDPSGLSEGNQVTAGDFARFCQFYVNAHPEALAELHSVKEFTYPLAQNIPPGKTFTPMQAQLNRNSLLGELGVDGLKTGFIDELWGYNIALTAKQGDMRLVAVILGVPGQGELQGSRNRAEAGRALLTWGFQNFVTVTPPVPAIKPVKVYKGAANEVTIASAKPIQLTVQRGLETKLTSSLHQETSVIAPVKKGDQLGEIVFAADGKEVTKVPLLASADVNQGGFFKRLWDSIRLTVSGWFHRGAKK